MKMLTLGLIVLMFGCKTKKNAENTVEPAQNTQTVKITAQVRDSKQDISDNFEILDHRVEGNNLFLKVSYSGGCKDHSFLVIGDPNIAKSLPPIRSVKLIHRSNQDACRELIEELLEIDITPLTYKKEEGSTIYLNFEGIEERITYIYQEPK
ncbi:MAG: hypothetical protein ACK45H_00905 [Bacteroidota bacterium]|jgi:hypothetical protein